LDIEALNQEFVNYLNFGGYPEAVFSETIRKDPGQYIKSDIAILFENLDLSSLLSATSAPLRLKKIENHLGSLYYR
jgi:predicted AAA+ superfamily ATPase